MSLSLLTDELHFCVTYAVQRHVRQMRARQLPAASYSSSTRRRWASRPPTITALACVAQRLTVKDDLRRDEGARNVRYAPEADVRWVSLPARG